MPQAKAGHFAMIAYAAFLGCLALSGGTSRADAMVQPVVRMLALGLMAILSGRPARANGTALVPATWFLMAIGAAIAVQLVPLPPGLWAMLPGRARYLVAGSVAGEAQPWRPINLIPDRGWNALFALLPPGAALLANARLRSDQQPIVLTALAMIVLASALLGLLQISAGSGDTLHLYPGSYAGEATGLLANRNHQALLLSCGIPILACWGLPDEARMARGRPWIAIGAICFLVLMIPATGSRAGLGLGLVGLMAGGLLAGPDVMDATRSLPARRRAMLAAGIGTGLLGLILLALTVTRAEAVQRLLRMDPADDARLQLVQPLIAAIRTVFPVGTGFGSFDPVYRGFEPFQNLSLTYMNQAHDDYLQVVMEAGVAGLALMIVFIGWWGWTSVRLWRRTGGAAHARGRLGSALLLLLLLASAVDYALRTPLMMVLATQAACWMLIAGKRREESRAEPSSRPCLLPIALGEKP